MDYLAEYIRQANYVNLNGFDFFNLLYDDPERVEEMLTVTTYWSAIIIYAGLMLAFSVYLLRDFFITIPESIVDSAIIRFQGRFRIDQPVILAGIFASMIPMVVIYLVGQRFFVQGLTAGALKGE